MGERGAARIGPATPILRMFDEARARDFYVRWLGFTVVFEHRFAPDLPPYLGLERDGMALHLSAHHGDTTPGTRVRIAVSDIHALHAELASRPHAGPPAPAPTRQPWGEWDMSVIDPFSNRLTFHESMP